MEVRPAITIRVLDAATGVPAACGARAVVTAPGFTETVQTPPFPGCQDFVLGAAAERAGTYSIVVSKAGYRDFSARNIVVTANACHVDTVAIEARLIR